MIDHTWFTHAYQPIYSYEKGSIVSYEVLLRGFNNEPPSAVFEKVPIWQRHEFDQISREKAIKYAFDNDTFNNKAACCLNLNFMPGSLVYKDGFYAHQTIATANKIGIHSKQLVIEITECEVVNSTAKLKMVLDDLRTAGATISIDDFGAGYSGLNLLADIQPDQIKLDMHLLRGIDTNGPRQSIVRAVNTVCLELGIDVLAEGVETQAELEFLRGIGIQLYQGFLFARPGFECFPCVSSVIRD